MDTDMIYEALIETAKGAFPALFSAKGLCGLSFPRGKTARPAPVVPQPVPAGVKKWARLTQDALGRVFSGKAPRVLPPLDFSSGTDFQQAVWRRMLAIPWGETQSYSELAKAIGKPRATRAVGTACGANRIPVLIPCHRVLAKGGGLGGFSGGLDWKRFLLSCENSGRKSRT